MSDPLAPTAEGREAAQMLSEVQAELARNRKENGDSDKPVKVLFGAMEVSPEVAGWAGVAWNIGLPHVRSKIESSIRSGALEKAIGERPAGILADTIGWGLIAAKPIEGATDLVSTYFKQRNELTDKLAPVIQAEGFSVGLNALHRGSLENNEIIQLELGRIAERAQSRFVKDVAAASLTVIPQAIVKNREDLIRVGSKPANTQSNAEAKAALARVNAEKEKKLREDATEIFNKTHGEAYKEDPVTAKELLNSIIKDLRGEQAENLKAEKAKHAAEHGIFSNENLINFGMPLAALAQKEAQASSLANADKHAKEKTAFNMIMKLQDVVERDGKLDVVEGKKLAAYVKEIFETHQKNMKRPAIGERNKGDLDYASQEIAQAISRGTLHPLALIHLVGDGEIVRNQGKSIATRAEVATSIAAMAAKMPAKYAVDPDKYLAETSFSEAEAKELVTKLPPAARDVFLSLMPDEVKLRVGASEEEIAQIHGRVKDSLAQQMQLMVFDMASRSDEDLKAQHLTEKEIKFVRTIAKESKAKGVASVLAAVSTHGNFKDGIEFPLVNDKSYWQSIVAGANIGDAYHNAKDELFTERLERERTEKLVDDRARKIIEEREHAKEHAPSHDSEEKKFASEHLKRSSESHVERVEGKGKPVNTSADRASTQDAAPASLAEKVLRERHAHGAHAQRQS